MKQQNTEHLITFYYCTKQVTQHPKKGHGTDSEEFKLTTLAVGSYYDHWLRATYNLAALHRFCTEGFTIIPAYFEGDRKEHPHDKGQGFISSNCIFLDCDKGLYIDRLKECLEEIDLHLNAYYNSFSYSADYPKHRLILTLDAPITDLGNYKCVLRFLIDLLDADKHCSDSLHIYYPGLDGFVLTSEPNNTSNLIKLALEHDKAKNERIAIAAEREREMLNNDVLTTLIDYAPQLDALHPWRRLVCDGEWLYHDDLFTIATSLILIDGGFEYMEDYISNQPYTESDRKRKLKWLKELPFYNRSPRMFTKNNTPIEGINGYSLYVLSKMLISNKEEGLLVEEKSHSINKNSENLIQSRNSNENSLHPRQGNGLVDYNTVKSEQSAKTSTKSEGLIEYISRQKSVLKIANKGDDKDYNEQNDIKHTPSSTKNLPLTKQLLDEDGNLYEQLDDTSLEARLNTIVTSKYADYSTLMEIDLFQRFVTGDRLDGIGTDYQNSDYPEHRALVYGMIALTQKIKLDDGALIDVKRFLHETASSHDFYERKKKAKKTILMTKIIKDVEGIKAANKKRFGINKIIPKSYHNGRCQTTLYLEYKELKQLEQAEIVVKAPEQYKYATVEENRAWLRERSFFDQPSGTVRVLEACTGLGKGVLLIDWIKEGRDCGLLGKMVVAVPDHKLLDETIERWSNEGLEYGTDFVSTPNVKTLPESILEQVEPYYALGLYSEAKKIIQESDDEEAKAYIDKEAIAKNFDGLVLTTHMKQTNGLSIRNDGTTGDYFSGREYIIYDECPSDHLIDITEIPLHEIEHIVDYLSAINTKSEDTNFTLWTLKDIFNTCKELKTKYLEDTVNIKGHNNKTYYAELETGCFSNESLYTAISQLKGNLTSKLVDLFNKDYVSYTKLKDNFLFGKLKSLDVSNSHITILSATPHLLIIKACFGEDNVKHDRCPLTKLKAKLYWVKTTRTSKSAMRATRNSYGKLSEEWSNCIKKITSETLACCKEFKPAIESIKSKYSSVVLTYPSAGLNAVQGKSLTAIGKYLEAEQSLLMKAILIGARPETLARNKFSLETRDYIRYSTYTFLDETLRELDVIAYERAMRQTIGRARPLDNAITVFFISDRALPLCDGITLDEFLDKVHISATEKGVTMNYQLKKDESSMFIDKLLGLRNEDGSLTEYGAFLLKEFNNDRKLILQYVTRATNNDIEGA